jgi:hypothetical protein
MPPYGILLADSTIGCATYSSGDHKHEMMALISPYVYDNRNFNTSTKGYMAIDNFESFIYFTTYKISL